MNTTVTHADTVAAPLAAVAAAMRIFLLEAHSEFLRLLRAPSFSVPTIAFPLMFYVLFGILLGPARAHAPTGPRVLASFIVLGTMAPGLFALGITLAADRERGLLELKRALPMPRGIYLAAKVAMAMLFAVVVSLLLLVLAALAGGVAVTLLQWGVLLMLALAGVIPFCAIGLLVGSLCKASAAPAVLNLIYLPMSFLSGLWVPLSVLPPALSKIAPLWPSWHLAQIAEAMVGSAPVTAAPGHVLALAAVACACFLVARRALGRPR
jgi:ABC-2 type transport system permease protein